MEIKKRLAREIVGMFHGGAAAQEAEAAFGKVHQRGDYSGTITPSGSLTVVHIIPLYGSRGGPITLRKLSDDLMELAVPFGHPVGLDFPPAWARPQGPGWSVPHILVDVRLSKSVSEARRLVQQGAVELDGVKLDRDYLKNSEFRPGATIRVGKHRFLRIVDADSPSKE
jgi:tyrosyl-tRNA synthetase